MTAHFFCWEPTLNIDPRRQDFKQRLREAQRQSGTGKKLRAFVASLLAEYPDATKTEDTPWATGPLEGEITGNFINFPVLWSWYDDELVTFVVKAAHSHGLHCFDPQSERFHESRGEELSERGLPPTET